ncbi:DUF397 domain-containing protein [Streptomyces sp. SDT5-1]|uniref:DUF397 domain-containing protein n=1 Tax=Streptomyces sp. SDT5-1 TaxID=3406418 RepID=UPI003FD51A5A
MSTGLHWFKSSYSSSEGGQCLEVAVDTTVVHVRDSKNPAGPHLTVAPEAWVTFVREEREGPRP